MALSLKPMNRQVIVITGATSGIGLATAIQAANAGAKIVLVSRSQDDLARVERDLEHNGATVAHVVADVASRDDLDRVAQVTVERFGGFDTWVNNAGVSIFGRLEEVSDADHRRLFETNFWGLVNGSLVAAAHFRERAARDRHFAGAVINLGSVASDVSFPMQGMYATSKHAVKGFTDALRMELEESGAPISVTLIKPAAIDTPFVSHARNYMSVEPKLPSPVYRTEEVANAIIHAAQTPMRDVYIGFASRVMSLANRIAPQVFDYIGRTSLIHQQQTTGKPLTPMGSLHEPDHSGGKVAGKHPGHVMSTSFYTRASLHPAATAVAIGTVALVASALLRRRPGLAGAVGTGFASVVKSGAVRNALATGAGLATSAWSGANQARHAVQQGSSDYAPSRAQLAAKFSRVAETVTPSHWVPGRRSIVDRLLGRNARFDWSRLDPRSATRREWRRITQPSMYDRVFGR